MAETIRTLIDEKIALFRDIDQLEPMAIAGELIELSSLWASVQKELIDREMWYNELMKTLVETHGTVAKANLYGKASPEYRQLLEGQAYNKSIQEMIRVGKTYVKLNEAVKRESIY